MARQLLILAFYILTGACSTIPKTFNPYGDASRKEIDSFLKIHIPFLPETKFTVSQGAFGKESHSEKGNEYSWDFDVPYGTRVTAVQDGEIVDVWQPNQGGGCESRLSNLAHNLKIRHSDKTIAQYVHIQTRLKKGDWVKAGQAIALTAQNGWICSPQLHFGIYKSEKHLYDSAQRQTLPVYFIEVPGGLLKKGQSF